MPFFRLIRPIDAITIELSHGNASHPHVPNVTGPMADWIQINDPSGGTVIGVLIELKVHPGRVAAEQNEIDSVSLLMGTSNRKWISRLNFTSVRRSYQIIHGILRCR
jgi:3-deoxy-D-arabino-heptulosonate 7-phosphate (DAHP) synthase